MEEIERDYLKVLLNKYSGHRLKVAEALGMSERNTFYRLLKETYFVLRPCVSSLPDSV
ncbi:MAG: helix-turn-helix domain-containing protein [Thiotrichaceae bacterium]|nr:helix-turn-helix domain-containing protein [Thiotrichaceae bacterium]